MEKIIFRNTQEKFRAVEEARDKLKTFLTGNTYSLKSKITLEMESIHKLNEELINARKKMLEVIEQTDLTNTTKGPQEKELLESLILTEQFIIATEQSAEIIKKQWEEILNKVGQISDLANRTPGLRNFKPI